MIRKRLRIALIAIPICLAATFIIGAEKSQRAAVDTVIDPTCTSSLPCIEYDNDSTGPAIRGVSLAGNGTVGFTKFNSTSASSGKSGIAGNDQSTSGRFDAGVRGASVRGTGVVGQTGTGTNPGPFALDAVFGNSAGSSVSVGVEGAVGPTFLSGGLAGVQGSNNETAIAVRANGFGGLLFDGNNSSNQDVFKVDDSGNTSIAGGGTVNGLSGNIALSAGTSASTLGVSGTGFSGIVGTGLGSNSWGVLAVNNGTGGGEALDIQDASGLGVLINAFDKCLFSGLVRSAYPST